MHPDWFEDDKDPDKFILVLAPGLLVWVHKHAKWGNVWVSAYPKAPVRVWGSEADIAFLLELSGEEVLEWVRSRIGG